MQSALSNPLPLRSILILFSHLYPGVPIRSFTLGTPTEPIFIPLPLYACLFPKNACLCCKDILRRINEVFLLSCSAAVLAYSRVALTSSALPYRAYHLSPLCKVFLQLNDIMERRALHAACVNMTGPEGLVMWIFY